MILVTGGSGFIGSRVVSALNGVGEELICTRGTRSRQPNGFPEESRNVWIDSDFWSLKSVFQLYDIRSVVHCATQYGRDGKDLEGVYQVNVTLPLNLMELSQEIPNFKFINLDTYYNKGTRIYPHLKGYSESKRKFLELARESAYGSRSKNYTVINLILEHCYGVGDRSDKFVMLALQELKKSIANPFHMTDGSQIRDFVYVEDVTSAILCALDLDACEVPEFVEYEVGTGVGTSICEFIATLKRILNSQREVCFGSLAHREHEILCSVADLANRSIPSWKPTIKLQDGLRMLAEVPLVDLSRRR